MPMNCTLKNGLRWCILCYMSFTTIEKKEIYAQPWKNIHNRVENVDT